MNDASQGHLAQHSVLPKGRAYDVSQGCTQASLKDHSHGASQGYPTWRLVQDFADWANQRVLGYHPVTGAGAVQ